VKKAHTKKSSRTDWRRIDDMKDEDIDLSDSPELDREFFKGAVLWPGAKRQITLRLDPDVLAFFQKQGKGYQTMINSVLRKYMEVRNRRAG